MTKTVTQLKLDGIEYLQEILDNGNNFHEFDYKTSIGFFYYGSVKIWGYNFAGIKKVTGLKKLAIQELKILKKHLVDTEISTT